MHIITGGAGFIGSAMAWRLNREGIRDIWLVDNLEAGEKWRNLPGLSFSELMSKEDFLVYLDGHGGLPPETKAVVHMGACSSTTERDADYLLKNNYQYTRLLAEAALGKGIRFVTASSAATYGGGENGYADDEKLLPSLRPLNMYGYSKHLFDLWASRTGALGKIASLKFFNVYGPNEYHKGDMASLFLKAYSQIRETGRLRLFKSYLPEFADGEQKRDFVYVKDVVDVMWWLLEHPGANGVMNVGSGRAESWNELARSMFAAMKIPENIEYIEMPESLRRQYQYVTKADVSRLREAGYRGIFRPLAEGARDYVENHLSQKDPYLH